MNNHGMIVVLGSPNSEKGELYSIAKERCDRAYELWKSLPHYKILMTGGFGAHFNKTAEPHAAYLKNHLVSLGIPESCFVEFAESQNTIEDASLSKPILLKYQVREAIIITSDYHFDRANYIFDRYFSDTEIHFQFSITNTNESVCEFDLEPIIRHEKEALAKLKNPVKKY